MKREIYPPKFFHQFFRWYCHPKLMKYIEGDLLELYNERVKELGKRKADFKFVWQVLSLFRTDIIKPTERYYNTNQYAMFKNYFIIGWRNLFRNKAFSLTNMLGLSIGMTCTILILLWVQDELTFDRSQKNYDHIYQIIAHRDFNNQVFTDRNMVFPLADAIEKEVSQVKNATVITHRRTVNFSYGEDIFKRRGYTTSTNFFDLFTVRFLSGDPSHAFDDPSSIVLTESMASTIFGDEDPINKVLTTEDKQDFKVTAVIADIPDNTSINFDYLMTFNHTSSDVQKAMKEWGNSSWEVYIQSLPGADIASIEKQINELKYRHDPEDKKISNYFAFPMNKWRLYSDFQNGINTGGLIQYVRMFTIIAVIILLIACINFMNLSTARSENRATEVGIRKSLGSQRKQLVFQFFTESIIIAFISFLITIITVYSLLPWFNALVDKDLMLDITSPTMWIAAIFIIAMTGIIAGSYPALYLSSFNPIKVLKGRFNSGKNAVLPRQILIVFQFAISMLLISATLIVYEQIKLIKNRDMGYNPNNLITIYGTGDTQKNYEVIKQELLQTRKIEAITRTMAPITQIWNRSPGPDWEGKPEGVNIIFSITTTDIDFTKTMGINMIAGSDFSGSPSDSSHVILNKAAMEVMGLDDPVGMILKRGEREFSILGVTENVIQDSPFRPVDPMLIFYRPENSMTISIRLNAGVQPREALTSVESIFKEYNPNTVFEFEFVDSAFEEKFNTENLIRKLSNIFAGLAIFICCIGLAGLVAFTIGKRIREIGIRKVLGASLQQILVLVSREFMKLVMIAFIISIPITWWIMSNWLLNYEYRITISIWIFALVGVLIFMLTLLVVWLNTFNAARQSPAKSLRTE